METINSFFEIILEYCSVQVQEIHDQERRVELRSYAVGKMFSFGQTPYTGMSPLQVIKALDSGYRLSRPEFCPKRLYDEIICKCLTFDPELRPTFNEIFKRLEELYPNGKISEAELHELRFETRPLILFYFIYCLRGKLHFFK